MYEHALVMRTAVLGSDGPKETFACIKNGIGRPEKRICTPLDLENDTLKCGKWETA